MLLGVAIAGLGYLIGFYVGVLATHSWIESVAPGTSAQLIKMDERQRKNRK